MRAGPNALVLLSLIAFTLPGCGPRRIMPPAAPESTYVGPEPTLDAAALKHFGQDTRGLVVVTDATPYAQAVVESGWLESLDPDQADRAEPDWAWVPRHVLMGWTELGERAIDRLVRVYMLGALAAAAGDPTSAVDDAERARVLQEMTAAVEALDADGLTIAVEFKSIPQAQQLMFALGAFLSGFAPTLEGGLEVQHSEDEIIVTLRTPAQWPGEALYEGLAEVHIGRVGDPDLPALVAALEGWRLEARVTRDGPWMVVRVGPRSTAPPLAVKDFALPRPSVPTGMPPVISGAFDMRGWREITRGWLALWARWQNTATGRHLARIDAAGDGQLTDLDTIGRRVEELGRTNAFRFDIDGGDVHLNTVDRAMPEVPSPLIADGILGWLPTDADAIGVDGERDFGRVLADMVWSIEDRLARRELQEDIRGADGNPFEAISEAYYRNFGPLRTLLLSEADLPYARPYAWVMATPDDAIPQIAVVSRLAKDTLPRAFLDRLLRLTLGPVVAGLPPAPPRPRGGRSRRGRDARGRGAVAGRGPPASGGMA